MYVLWNDNCFSYSSQTSCLPRFVVTFVVSTVYVLSFTFLIPHCFISELKHSVLSWFETHISALLVGSFSFPVFVIEENMFQRTESWTVCCVAVLAWFCLSFITTVKTILSSHILLCVFNFFWKELNWGIGLYTFLVRHWKDGSVRIDHWVISHCFLFVTAFVWIRTLALSFLCSGLYIGGTWVICFVGDLM